MKLTFKKLKEMRDGFPNLSGPGPAIQASQEQIDELAAWLRSISSDPEELKRAQRRAELLKRQVNGSR